MNTILIVVILINVCVCEEKRGRMCMCVFLVNSDNYHKTGAQRPRTNTNTSINVDELTRPESEHIIEQMDRRVLLTDYSHAQQTSRFRWTAATECPYD